MRVPISWLKEFVKLPKDQNLLTEKLTFAGHLFDKIDTSNSDTVLDLELRGNRADCYSIFGIAREISALFESELFSPPLHTKLEKVKQLKECFLKINSSYVKRVMMVTLSDINIVPSPKWMKDKLEAYGIPSINNIVDLTNYIMIETGEPMHAFDLDQIGNNIEIRLARKSEKMATFLGETITLSEDDLVWANNNSILSIAGAIGEKNHSISGKTTNVLIEAANYDRSNIRRTIYRHHLLTDAGIRHEKDLDPNNVEYAVYRALKIIEENGWGKVKPYIYDYYPKPIKPWSIKLNYDYLELLGGVKLNPKNIKNILERINFKITSNSSNSITVLCPTYRTDVTFEEDLIEEILRIYGYTNISERVLSFEIPKIITPPQITQEISSKNILTGFGFDEIISSSFVSENNLIFNRYLDNNITCKSIRVINRPSPDVEILRTTLFPNLLSMTQKVINYLGNEIRFFEIGKVFYQEKKKYFEKRKLALIYWSKNKVSRLKFKGWLEGYFEKSNIENISYKETSNSSSYFTNSYNIFCNNICVGYGFSYEKIYFVEIDLDLILDKARALKVNLWPKYPPQIEDITIKFPEKTHIGDVLNFIKIQNSIKNVLYKGSYKNSSTFKIWFQNTNKTLDDKEVEKIRNNILDNIKIKYGGVQNT